MKKAEFREGQQEAIQEILMGRVTIVKTDG